MKTVQRFTILVTLALAASGCVTDTASGPENEVDFDDGKLDAFGGSSRAVLVTFEGNGLTFDVEEGQLVVLELPSNPSTGYEWQITMTDRTFGYPDLTEYQAEGDMIGGSGVTRMVWNTGGGLPMTGEHHVRLEYRRSWEEEAIDQFSFAVNVIAPQQQTGGAVISTEDEGRAIHIVEGESVVVELPSNSEDFTWAVASTDRTFGYPSQTEYFVDNFGQQAVRMTWTTGGGLPMVGTHLVELRYQAPDFSVADIFRFSVVVNPAEPEAGDDALVLTFDNHGQTFSGIVEGTPIVVELPVDPYGEAEWIVGSTDRTFGYPAVTENFQSGEMIRMIWNTDGALSMVGEHRVHLAEYHEQAQVTIEEFDFTVVIVPR